MNAYHIPVMVEEVVEALQVKAGGRYIDCTAGEGGHSLAIINAAVPPPSILCLDMDEKALLTAAKRMQHKGATIRKGTYAEVARLAAESGFFPSDGLLLDLGVSSLQLDSGERGFSFRHEARLDMRFDSSQEIDAYAIVNGYGEVDLANVIHRFGEERRSRRIARAIVRNRPISTTKQLAEVVSNSVGVRRGRIHPATRTFQAVRIAVNDEFGNIHRGLDGAVETLGAGGRLAVITYHSLEDRIVKNTLRRMAASCICPPSMPQCICEHEPTVSLVNRRVIRPSVDEIRRNARSRSARLRVAERL